jgi:DNA-binding transcriptional MocR family regulator
MAELASIWIENGTALRIIEWKRSEMRARNELAFSILSFYKDRPHSTACHIWLTLPEPWRSEAFAAQARSRGVNVSPSEVFVAGRGVAPHAVRVCLGAPQDRSQLEKGIRILAEILQGLPQPALSAV